MRIGFDHSSSSATDTRRRVASSRSDAGFADALASAAEANDDEGTSANSRKPELSAATYRLFAAVALQRGDTAHADHFRARAADAREAGLPVHPSGVLAENGRWDYTPAAALIPETGRFDSRSGQGVLRFTSYGPADTERIAASDPRDGSVGSDQGTADVRIDRVPDRQSRSSALLQTSRGASTQSVSVAEWWEALHRIS